MAGSPALSTEKSSGNAPITNNAYALAILTSLFFMWGLLTSLNDILIPHLKAVFDLSYTEAMLVQFVFFFAYFVISMPSSWIIEKTGYKKGVIIGLTIAGIGSLAFYPAAALRSYGIFLTAFFILASGITLLQVAANPYVAILGAPQTSSARLNLTQAFNSLGTTIGPFFGSILILSVGIKTADELAAMSTSAVDAYKLAEASAVQVPYLGIAAALFLLAAAIAFFKLPEITADSEGSSDSAKGSDTLHESAWGYRHLYLGAIAIFVYVGAEVAIGSFLVNYFGESNIMGMTEAQAGKFVAFYWGGAMIGRFVGAAVLRKISPNKVLAFNAIAAGFLVIVSMLTSGSLAMWAILLVGLFNSIMFPTIFTLGVKGLGRHTKKGSGILIMAIVGGAIIPLVQGALADTIGIQHAFILPVICYLYIAFYGAKGSIPEFVSK